MMPSELSDVLAPLLRPARPRAGRRRGPGRARSGSPSTGPAASTSTPGRGQPRSSPARSTSSTRSPGRYTLEVSSPGLERRLRTPGHFARAHGRDGDRADPARAPATVRRVHGPLASADDDGLRARGPRRARRLAARSPTTEIERARTVFEWGRQAGASSPDPGQAGGRSRPQPSGATTPDSDDREGHDAMSKTNFEFLDALGQIARDKGISVETLLDALANALVAAYKRRPGRGRGGRRHHRPRLGRDPGLRPGARRGRQRHPGVGRHPRRLRPHRRPDGQAGHPPAHPRGRAGHEVRGVRRAARATSSPASSSRPTTATPCSTWARSRRCCPRPSRSPTSATSTGPA